MSLSLSRKRLVLIVVGSLLATIVVPVTSVKVDSMPSILNESCESTTQPIEYLPFNSTFPYPVADIDINERLSEREVFERDLHERYPWRYDEDLRNDSEYPFDEPFYNHHDHGDIMDAYHHRFNDEYVKNHTIKDRKPTPKPNFADGNTIYVDDDNTEGPWDGTQAHPYQHIQDGINIADDGDIVFVYNGTYYENVVVDKSVKLEGENRNTTIIDGGGDGDTLDIGYVSAVVTQFTLENASKGINIDVLYGNNFYSYFEIFCNIIKNITGSGIEIDCNYNDNSKIEISIIGNIIKDIMGSGIEIDCNYNDNSKIEIGIIGNIIINCHRFSGLEISSHFSKNFRSDINIINNVISNNTGDGIDMWGVYNCNITGNVISNNTGDGIDMWGVYNYNITGNVISNNTGDGIDMWGLYNKKDYLSLISKNRIVNNNGNGLSTYYSYNTIFNNSILNNYENGINIEPGSDSNIILKNYIERNFIDGISLRNSYGTIINGNTISSNFGNGIFIKYSSINIISNCTIQNHNYSSGILLEGSDDTIIQNSMISDNMRGGIKLDNLSRTTTINRCSLTNNSWGIDLTTSRFNRIEKCTISNNIFGGIHRGRLNIITRNNFIDNYNHYFGLWGDKNFFLHNYWSDRFVQSPLPYHVFNLNFDWFPRATPYDYPYLNETLVDDSSSTFLDGDVNGQNARSYLNDVALDRLSSLFSKVYYVLDQDHCHLLNRWRDDR